VLLLVQLISEFPDASSPDPALAMVRGGGHAFAIPGKHDAVSFWVDLSDCEAFRTFDPSQEQVYQREGENASNRSHRLSHLPNILAKEKKIRRKSDETNEKKSSSPCASGYAAGVIHRERLAAWHVIWQTTQLS
jgi:hypothetical protein